MERVDIYRHRGLVYTGILVITASVMMLAGCAGGSGIHRSADLTTACMRVSDYEITADSGIPGLEGMPEIATGYVGKKAVRAHTFMVVAANPLATRTACDVLQRGGSAVDAAVAAQMVLTLVEPQSSGIGGGAFMLHYDAKQHRVTAYDGRETAPAAATENYLRWISNTDQRIPQPNARASGRSIGTPGVLHMLNQAHADYGRLSWSSLFDPAINLAVNGFIISPRMAASIESSKSGLQRDPRAAAYFLLPDGGGKPVGTLLKNPQLATTFQTIAQQGAGVFYHGEIAGDIVTTVADTSGNITPGMLSLEDLRNYRSKKREAVCTSYRERYIICGMPPPSSGGITVASAMGILENFDLSRYAPADVDRYGGHPSIMGVHLVTEAERLAYADRNKYIADTDFVPLPGGSWDRLLDKGYLAQRARLISMSRSIGTAQPGSLGLAGSGPDRTPERGTSHLSIVDAEGNAVVMTTSIEAAFGSFHMTKSGFLLNNQLTDFSAVPADSDGRPIANRLQPGKRPRSSMAPTLVFHAGDDGRPAALMMATGSPGGGAIIYYVIKALVGTLDWGLDAQQAVSQISFGSMNGAATYIGGEHPLVNTADDGNHDPLVSGLRALGHTVLINAQSSGLASIVCRSVNAETVLEGGADPRREGIAQGDSLR